MRTGSRSIVANTSIPAEQASALARDATRATGEGVPSMNFKRALRANESYGHQEATNYHHKQMQLHKMSVSAGPVFGTGDSGKDEQASQKAELHKKARDAHQLAGELHEKLLAPPTWKGSAGLLNQEF